MRWSINLISNFLVYLRFQANVLINDAEKACIADFGIASIQEHAEPPPLTELEPYAQQALLLKCREALKDGGMSVTLASSLSSRMSSFSGAGTYRWMAPERLIPEALDMPSAKPTFASDVFSLAMLAIEVSTIPRFSVVPLSLIHNQHLGVYWGSTISWRQPECCFSKYHRWTTASTTPECPRFGVEIDRRMLDTSTHTTS